MSDTTLTQQPYEIREVLSTFDGTTHIEGRVEGALVCIAIESAGEQNTWYLSTFTDVAAALGVVHPSVARCADAAIARQWVEFITALYAAHPNPEGEWIELDEHLAAMTLPERVAAARMHRDGGPR